MSRLDHAAACTHSFSHGKLHRAARVRREPLYRRFLRRATPELFDHLFAHCLLIDPRCVQRAAGRVALFAQHRKEQMLAPHVSVPQFSRRRLRAAQHLLGAHAEFPVVHLSASQCVFVLSFLTTFPKNKRRKRHRKFNIFLHSDSCIFTLTCYNNLINLWRY